MFNELASTTKVITCAATVASAQRTADMPETLKGERFMNICWKSGIEDPPPIWNIRQAYLALLPSFPP